MSLRKLAVIPQLIYYMARAPRRQAKAWDVYWRDVRRTGPDGHVLWDTGDPRESDEVLAHLRAHADAALPIVDVGCGNGRFSRLFAKHFPRVVAGDVSAHAITRARAESAGVDRVAFRDLDISAPGVGAAVHRELGSDANVFMRGVLHVLDPKKRATAVDNLAAILGEAGTVYLSETNIDGDPLDHLVLQGATATSMPDPLRRCIAAGIRPPSRFGENEIRSYFPTARWRVLASGPATMYTVPLTGREIEPIASYFAVIRRSGL
jgi:SAM-dependent methyltransferase